MRINGDDSNLRGTADIFFSLSRLRRDDAKLIQICTVLTRDKGRERESICVITRRKMFGMNHYRPPPPFLRISLFFLFLSFFFYRLKTTRVSPTVDRTSTNQLKTWRARFVSLIFCTNLYVCSLVSRA